MCYEQCRHEDGYRCPLEGQEVLEDDVQWMEFSVQNLLSRKRGLGSPAAERGPGFTATSHPPGERSREESRPLRLLLIAEVPALVI
ncbi:hypothetical protein HPB50_012807 [Hyalomma asiaticum]|uniref:Uncharacterized protein n=1 Tax=Hyalomma asiaticum TaxID=266040 RepID=A0ACB7RNT8_HYAAI|nr:hypothetical protein HPB50_012807 [Hyalomma asiaticum]